MGLLRINISIKNFRNNPQRSSFENWSRSIRKTSYNTCYRRIICLFLFNFTADVQLLSVLDWGQVLFRLDSRPLRSGVTMFWNSVLLFRFKWTVLITSHLTYTTSLSFILKLTYFGDQPKNPSEKIFSLFMPFWLYIFLFFMSNKLSES